MGGGEPIPSPRVRNFWEKIDEIIIKRGGEEEESGRMDGWKGGEGEERKVQS